MNRLVVLKLGEGSFEQGFPVTLQIGQDGHGPALEIAGRLPAAPDLYQSYTVWAATYRNLGMRQRLEASTAAIAHVSRVEDCYSAARVLGDQLNHWLYAESFRPIREKLLEQLMPSDCIRFILQTEHIGLRRLPWHLWDFCDRYPKTEIALSAPAYERVDPMAQFKPGVRTLAILGNSVGIDTQTDRQLLERLPGAEVSLLVEPQRQELTNELWRQSWDILFFAGHSTSHADGAAGRIHLNQSDSLTISQLKYALRKAVGRGLQVAIFNSCDGLGLAHELEDVQIPQIIVMREPVPDRVAQEFLKSFLTAFSRGESFYLAVREARERLQGLENEFPCATWLPIICQNPAVVPPTWEQLGGSFTTPPEPAPAPDPAAVRRQMMATFPPDTLINQRYQIQEVLGQGGFGRTYLAVDTHRFGDLCVLKQFAPATQSESAIRRSRQLFEREAKVLYQINHPQIPKFLAWFTQDAQLFIVQEYIEGKTYLKLLQERQQQRQTFSEAEVIRWLQELLPVLDYLHSINIVHRDISLSNIMQSEHTSHPILIDFGVVKEVASQIWSGQFGSMQAPPASRIGKPGYAPPEQMQMGQCYPCSDLYALAVTALVMLTGKDPRTLAERLPSGRWHQLVRLSPRLTQIFDRMLAEHPGDRYQTAQAVLTDLEQLDAPAQLLLEPTQSTQQPSTWIASPTALADALPQPQEMPQDIPQDISRDTPRDMRRDTPQDKPRDRSREIPQRIPQPLSEPETRQLLDPAFVDQCRRELARQIGPMAACIVEDVLMQNSQVTPQQFVDALAAEIPSSRQAQAFVAQLQPLLKRQAELEPPSDRLSATVRASTSSWIEPDQPDEELDRVTPEFVDRCRRILAQSIGPMANYILEDILAQSPNLTPQELVQSITTEIPDARIAKEFQQKLSQSRQN